MKERVNNKKAVEWVLETNESFRYIFSTCANFVKKKLLFME